jgi:dynamin 1-like protein
LEINPLISRNKSEASSWNTSLSQTGIQISSEVTDSSIILAVTPANIDLVNSEGLKLARQVDPAGKRTIGVLTKLDLMDHGTNALEILAGRVYPLKLGFIGVVNRSQHDISQNKSLKDALKAEEAYFRQTPAYRNIAHRCGTHFLAKSLNTVSFFYYYLTSRS